MLKSTGARGSQPADEESKISKPVSPKTIRSGVLNSNTHKAHNSAGAGIEEVRSATLALNQQKSVGGNEHNLPDARHSTRANEISRSRYR